MRGSLHLATVAGIPVKIHWTFGLLPLWVIILTIADSFDPWAILINVGVVFILFFCVILHEFGHAMAARRYHIRTFDIIMTPIGGIARLERMPEGRGQEFWIAIAGPMVNYVIVGVMWLAIYFVYDTPLPLLSPSFWNIQREVGSYFEYFLMANGFLGTFNLLPAFPMDGGRMLRSLLSLRMDRLAATRIASYIGQALAFVLFIAGVVRGLPILALIGVFIFFAARQEYRVLLRQNRVSRTRALDLMEPIQHQLFTGQEMDSAIEMVSHLQSPSFIVWSRPGVPAGFITRDKLMQHHDNFTSGELIDSSFTPTPVAVSPELSGGHLYALMHQHQLPIVLVYDQINYLGVVYWEKVASLLKES